MTYNKRMYELYPYFTNDGSVGLFSYEADDIYHSTLGAFTEAYEKFVLPINLKSYMQKKTDFKILDICFGIGYNTKSFLNEFYKILYNEEIYTDNKNINYNDKIDTNNKKYKLYIHAVDTDKILANLSPFFKTAKNNSKINKIDFKNEKIEQLLSESSYVKYELQTEINFILLNKLINNIDSQTEEILFSKDYSKFFDKDLINFYKFLKKNNDKYTPAAGLNTFLHNIYYRYTSKSNKIALKDLETADIDFDLSINDARQVISKDKKIYDFIFLDAFTPSKCPCLWTVDFFKQLYNRLNDDGMILTYSNSAAVRNAFLTAGFFVGKIYCSSYNKYTGTLAVKNKSLIKNELSQYDLGLTTTKAGIFYRDETLTASNEAILEAHKADVENSNLLSSSQFIKRYGRKK